MENTFVFDRITAEDKDVFIDMSREFYASDAVLAPVPEKFHTKAFEELMKGDRYLVGFIIRYGQKAAGYALLAKSYSREAGGEMLWLDEIYLKGDYRGMGAAKKFFAFMHERFSPARFRLEVESDNKRAIALYEKNGYKMLPYVQMIRDN